MQIERLCISMEYLDEQPFGRLKVDVWIQVIKIKIDVDMTLLS